MQVVTTRPARFYGNGPYCYANSTSMLLSSIGEDIPPAEIEAYTGVGLGAFLLPSGKELFFSNLSNAPDKGITRALSLLGFEFKESATENAKSPPYDQLRSDLASSPAVLGPLDMGYLPHNPLHKRMMGADHFVLAYNMDENGVSIHDPEGFPSVHLPFKQLEQTWKAENIPYRRGYYRYWTRPVRKSHPSKDQLYRSTLESFKQVYAEGEKISKQSGIRVDDNAILEYSKHVRNDKVGPGERGFMVFFSLKLGARRAADFARFFAGRDDRLAELKWKQSELFGSAQASAVDRKWSKAADSLERLAEAEREFRTALSKI